MSFLARYVLCAAVRHMAGCGGQSVHLLLFCVGVQRVVGHSVVLCWCTESGGSFCGNFRVEEDEQCDAGIEGDLCCDGSCRLRAVSKCRCFCSSYSSVFFLGTWCLFLFLVKPGLLVLLFGFNSRTFCCLHKTYCFQHAFGSL